MSYSRNVEGDPCIHSEETFYQDYGVKFDGSGWSKDEKAKMMREMEMDGETLARLIGHDDPAAVFRKVHSEHYYSRILTIKNEGSSGGCNASAYATISCGSGVEPGTDFDDEGLILHEIGHKFDSRTLVSGRNDLAAGIIVNGKEIVGTSDGFQELTQPYQQHPNGGDGEEFADMYMNYFYSKNNVGPLGFSADVYGQARMAWMDKRMRSWTLDLVYGP